MESRRRASNLEEGLKNTEIKRETDIRNSLGPQEGGERGQSSDSKRSSGRSRAGDMSRSSDAYGRETPGVTEDLE